MNQVCNGAGPFYKQLCCAGVSLKGVENMVKTLPRTREYECIVCACDCLKEVFHMVRTAQGTH